MPTTTEDPVGVILKRYPGPVFGIPLNLRQHPQGFCIGTESKFKTTFPRMSMGSGDFFRAPVYMENMSGTMLHIVAAWALGLHDFGD